MENNENTQQETQETTNSEITTDAGIDETEEENNSILENEGNNSDEDTIPEGFDVDTYDIENKSLKIDGVKKKFDDYNTQIDSLKKQALDLRRKLSKGKDVPDSQDKYDYVADEKYDKYFLDNDTIYGKHVRSTMDAISKLSFDNGLTKEQSKSVKDFMLNYMDMVKVIDTRSSEEIEKEQKAELMKQKDILGEDYEKIINENVDYFKERGPFNKQEREFLIEAIKKYGRANSVLAKVRKLIDGSSTFTIPETSNVDESVERLRKEYMAKDTSDKRREQIIRQSIKEGWSIY